MKTVASHMAWFVMNNRVCESSDNSKFSFDLQAFLDTIQIQEFKYWFI